MCEFVYSSKNPEAPVAYTSFEAMHTILEAVIISRDEAFSKKVFKELYDLTKHLESLFNRFDSQSLVWKLNKQELQGSVVFDESILPLLASCEDYRKGTQGYFDITVQSPKKGHKQIDLGGIAKGYTLEKIGHLLSAHTVKRALVNFGNSSVLAVGTHPYGNHWPVDVEDTMRPGFSAYHFELSDNALSLSGLTSQGKAHIKNPLSGQLVEREEIIAVTGESPLTAEALSTALYVAPDEVRPQILGNYKGYSAYSIQCKKDGKTAICMI